MPPKQAKKRKSAGGDDQSLKRGKSANELSSNCEHIQKLVGWSLDDKFMLLLPPCSLCSRVGHRLSVDELSWKFCRFRSNVLPAGGLDAYLSAKYSDEAGGCE